MRFGKLSLAILFTGLCVASMPSQAQTYYTDRTSFNTANPGLALENLDEATLVPFTAVNAPLDKNSNNINFTPGQIKDGLRLDAPGTSADQFFINNSYGGTLDTSIVATTNYSSNSADLIFYNNNVTAAGVDLFNGTYTVNIFGAGNALLGTQTVDASKGAFFGVSASQVITRINLNNIATYETFDNIAFGGAAPMSTPEPGSVALLAGMGLSGAGFLARRRKNARKAA